MKKSAGFSAVGIVLIVLAIALAGVVAWRVYEASRTKGTDQTNTTGQSSQQSVDNSTYLDIKELGIKIKLSEGIKDATYSARTLSDGSIVAYFSTQSLSALDANCSAQSGPLGAIEKTRVDTDQTGAKKVVNNQGTFKFGDYYFTYSGPQALCSEKVRGVEGQSGNAFFEALKTMQLDR